MTGEHLAYSASIIDSRRGSLRWTVWERKFVFADVSHAYTSLLPWAPEGAGGTWATYIDEDRIRRNESGVVLEEQSGGGLGNLADNLTMFGSFLLLSFDIAFLVLLESYIA